VELSSNKVNSPCDKLRLRFNQYNEAIKDGNIECVLLGLISCLKLRCCYQFHENLLSLNELELKKTLTLLRAESIWYIKPIDYS